MPQLGVMREILEREEESMRVEADFFSVARTMPLVAGGGSGLVVLMGLQGKRVWENLLCRGRSLLG